MSYPEALRYLESFVNYEKLFPYPYQKALNLKRVQDFLDLIKNPERSLKFIHIAGTKGKGSTGAFITYILREAGFKTGLYTSPHLEDFRERIRILSPSLPGSIPGLEQGGDFEGMIPKAKFGVLVRRLKPALEKYNRASSCGALSFFEICTILALVYFKEEKVDFAVLETGLGGRLDATNIVMPLVSVITPISYEHMDKLGRTLKKIASEKAGIIKKNSIVICAPQEGEALEVIKNKCKKESAKLRAITFNFCQKIPNLAYRLRKKVAKTCIGCLVYCWAIPMAERKKWQPSFIKQGSKPDLFFIPYTFNPSFKNPIRYIPTLQNTFQSLKICINAAFICLAA